MFVNYFRNRLKKALITKTKEIKLEFFLLLHLRKNLIIVLSILTAKVYATIFEYLYIFYFDYGNLRFNGITKGVLFQINYYIQFA